MCVFFFCIVLLVFLLLYKYIFFLPFIVYLQSKQTREKVTVYWRAPFEFSWKRGFTSKVLVCCLYGSRLEAVLTHSVRASSLPERCPLSWSLYQEQRKHIQTSIWLPSACYNEEVHPAQFSPPPSLNPWLFLCLTILCFLFSPAFASFFFLCFHFHLTFSRCWHCRAYVLLYLPPLFFSFFFYLVGGIEPP